MHPIAMDTTDRQTAYWNQVAAHATFTHPLCRDLLQTLITPSAHILDYGCGYGRTCAELVHAGYRNTIGVDTSSAMIARGRSLHPDLQLHQITEGALPFAEATFDVCLLLAVLTCIPTDAGQRHVIDEVRRVLRPGGILYLSDYPLQHDARNRARYARDQQRCDVYGAFHLAGGGIARHHEMSWIEELLAPFALMRHDRLTVPTMHGHEATIFQILARQPSSR